MRWSASSLATVPAQPCCRCSPHLSPCCWTSACRPGGVQTGMETDVGGGEGDGRRGGSVLVVVTRQGRRWGPCLHGAQGFSCVLGSTRIAQARTHLFKRQLKRLHRPHPAQQLLQQYGRQPGRRSKGEGTRWGCQEGNHMAHWAWICKRAQQSCCTPARACCPLACNPRRNRQRPCTHLLLMNSDTWWPCAPWPSITPNSVCSSLRYGCGRASMGSGGDRFAGSVFLRRPRPVPPHLLTCTTKHRSWLSSL